MRPILALLFATLCILPAFAEAARSVRGYTKRNGTYVAPHYRTSPDRSRSNNWSHKGNTNPYTGKRGSKK